MNQQKVNSVIEVNDGTYLVAETVQQIQEQSQKGALVSLHITGDNSNVFFNVLFNVKNIEMVADYENTKKENERRQNNQSEQVGSDFLKGFADYLYNKYGKDD